MMSPGFFVTKAEQNVVKKKLAWRKEDVPPSVDEPLSTFEKATE